MGDDIEQFIREQKAKLIREKDSLTTAQNVNDGSRKKWEKDTPEQINVAVENDVPSHEKINSKALPNQQSWYDQQRQQLQEERRQEYNQLLQKKNPGNQQRPQSAEHIGLPVGGYDQRRKRLEEERKKEYNQLLSQKQPRANSTKPPPTPEHIGLPVSNNIVQRRKLEDERNQEYNSLLAKKNERSLSTKPSETHEHVGLPLGENDLVQRRELEEKRRQEYNALLSKKNGFAIPSKENIPPKPSTPDVGLVGKLGSYEDRRKKLQEERQKEYNSLLAKQNLRSTGQGSELNGAYIKSLPGMIDRTEEKIQREKDRNEEYNNLVRKKQAVSFSEAEAQKHNQYQKYPEDEYFATLPVRDHPSAEAEKIRNRNREYNDVLKNQEERKYKERQDRMHPGQPRTGWATPTYDEILEKKRQEERGYRRHDDDPDVGMRLGGPNYLRASRSDGFLNVAQEEENRLRALDQEYEARKQRYLQEKQAESVLEDSNWLRYETGVGQLGKSGNGAYGSVPDLPRDLNYGSSKNVAAPHTRDRVKSAPRYGGSVREQPYVSPQGRGAREQPSSGSTGLQIGREITPSADQRRKEAYRQDLLRQMEEINSHKIREKQTEMQINLSGANDPEKRPDRLRDLPAPTGSVPTSSHTPAPQGYYPRDKDFSPRDIVYGDLNRTKATSGSGGILERGFEGLFEPSSVPTSSYQRPYNPSSGVPLRGVGGPGTTHTPADDAYHYFGMKNLLDPNTAQELPTGHAGLAPIHHDTDPGFNPTLSSVPAFPKQVTFDERSLSRNAKPESTTGGLPFPSREDGKDRSKQQQYQQELQRQIEEAKLKKQKEKEEKERYDRKLEEEIRNYDPFGRGGGGAPMKDRQGNVIADLRRMHQDNEDTLLSPRRAPPPPDFSGPTMVGLYDQPTASKVNTFSTPRGGDASTYARGGHGIFGEPKTDEQKSASDRYKEDLQKQIDEKRRIQEQEKEKERQKELLEEKRLEEERRRIALEYEEELRKKREKEEETNRKNEELKRQAEERKLETERRRQAAEEERLADRRREQETERLRRQEEPRGSSPPVPAVRSKTESLIPDEGGRRSPPVPAVSTQQRAGSADVLNQLARMRMQLQSERRRVENALDNQPDDVEVFDSRIQHKPPTASRRRPMDQVDVFEVARNREPVSVRRAPSSSVADPVNPHYVDQFNNLKHKSNSQSRQAFREMFPSTPTNADTLEIQQTELLRQQEESLKSLQNNNKRSRFEDAMPNMNPRDLGLLRENTIGSQTPLESESAFIGFDSDDPLSIADYDKSRNNSARSRRRQRLDSVTPSLNSGRNNMGSTTSLDPDRITRRNEERLRKLQNLGGDEISTGDPDDILERFMARQQHDRPSSRATLKDDSWLRPSSKTGR